MRHPASCAPECRRWCVGVQDGARLTVVRRKRRKADVDEIKDALLECNPRLTRAKLEGKSFCRDGLVLNDDGTVKSWSLSRLGLRELPDIMGDLVTTDYLSLYENDLVSLPDGFGDVSVGRRLALNDNKLTTLPKGFENISVGNYLSLKSNPLTDATKVRMRSSGLYIKHRVVL